ncbi:hypothetical protein QNH46_16950 [Paenibacillus woosongensis]|uniref:BIG2 domain-containing protein n=1 Tax=Paenibacillus woosongensis TaxID=307580 RepID=A0AA95I2X4_9BACL|nr:hypothetical protein [Paenibacillus woosongensis]WHX47821.1 hypothetical protein QNH46_16950 [Paenibacillus woosongensis]
MSVTANYSDETQTDVTSTASYSTSNEAVATVSEAGVVSAVSAGISVITATYENESVMVGVKITTPSSSGSTGSGNTSRPTEPAGAVAPTEPIQPAIVLTVENRTKCKAVY